MVLIAAVTFLFLGRILCPGLAIAGTTVTSDSTSISGTTGGHAYTVQVLDSDMQPFEGDSIDISELEQDGFYVVYWDPDSAFIEKARPVLCDEDGNWIEPYRTTLTVESTDYKVPGYKDWDDDWPAWLGDTVNYKEENLAFDVSGEYTRFKMKVSPGALEAGKKYMLWCRLNPENANTTYQVTLYLSFATGDDDEDAAEDTSSETDQSAGDGSSDGSGSGSSQGTGSGSGSSHIAGGGQSQGDSSSNGSGSNGSSDGSASSSDGSGSMVVASVGDGEEGSSAAASSLSEGSGSSGGGGSEGESSRSAAPVAYSYSASSDALAQSDVKQAASPDLSYTFTVTGFSVLTLLAIAMVLLLVCLVLVIRRVRKAGGAGRLRRAVGTRLLQ
jgi:hypothetical protein